MSATKIKFYKNPDRNRNAVVHKPYVPQYQVMGVEPIGTKSSNPVIQHLNNGPQDNPRLPRPAIRQQPYAEVVDSPIGRGRGPLPNVGNNMEQTWSSVDGEIVDDITDKLNPNHPMVDNNDIVSANALGLTEEVEEDIPSSNEGFLNENVLQNALQEDFLTKVIKQLEEDEYCILVEGNPICSGPYEYIEEQTRALVFGEHELYSGNPVSSDDIIVIKRAKIKVGVFLG